MGTTQTKLTLRMDRGLIQRVKSYARQSGKSVSAIVADFFELLDERKDEKNSSVTPAVRSLIGVMARASVSEQDYRKHLERKHR